MYNAAGRHDPVDLRQLGLIQRDRQGTDVVVQMVRRLVPGIGTMSPGTGLLDVRKVPRSIVHRLGKRGE